MLFQDLPVELIADILGELDLKSLITVAYVSKCIRSIASDSSLNPWRRPILRILHSKEYETEFKHLSVRSIVPRQNWIEILSIAPASFLLFEATLPNLSSVEWEECFKRRFLPGWQKWKKECSWKEAFLKILHRVWHRSVTPCTIDEGWTQYIVLNRNNSANKLQMSSRNFNPLAVMNDMKLQNNLSHLETRVRLVLEIADIRVLAFGTLNRPTTRRNVNQNAHLFLHPPGIEADESKRVTLPSERQVADHGVYPMNPSLSPASAYFSCNDVPDYDKLTHPRPAKIHANYPFYTPGGSDKRWIITGEDEEEGLEWVGGIMITAQIIGPHTHDPSDDWVPLQDLDLAVGAGRHQYASFTWQDLWTIAPWMEENITKTIDGPGLGIF